MSDGHERQRKLGESEARMRLLVENIRDYAIFMLDTNGHVTSWNPGAERINGYTADEIIGQHFSIFYPREGDVQARCAYELRVAAETGRFEEEQWRVRKDGTRFWANVVISAVRDADGTLVGYGKVTRDLTERRRAEMERAALVAAEDANRAKDEFLAMLGHELRNPLAPIMTALEVMKLRGDTPWTKEHLVIERQLQHVVRLVNDLLDVAGISQGKVELKQETFELYEAVSRGVEIALPLIHEREHALRVEVPQAGLRVRADQTRLSQVFANLINNAAKYTPPHGRIEVAAHGDGSTAIIRVRDNGIGIAPDLLPRIFDLFVQGPRTMDRAQGGLGIGLSLVQSLVELQGGSVGVVSDGPGRGSEFTVRLPVASRVVSKTPLGSSAVPAAEQPQRILIVDDNVDAADLLAELLRTLGHELRVAHDGEQALQIADELRPQIALVDIGLPRMDGYELAQHLRARLGTECRLIALTGYGQDSDRQRSRDAGFDEHLVKPIDIPQVRRLIGSAAS